MRPSEQMTKIGVVQEGDPLLDRPAQEFDLPVEADDARTTLQRIHEAMDRIAAVHDFSKGMGLAANQIGIDRAAAVVRSTATEVGPVELLNPVIVDSSPDTDEQYEGCLSFFDVRCQVPRPLTIHVEHEDVTGEKHITAFERGLARLVAHEVDHLHGVLCRDHLPTGRDPIPVEQYRGTGTSWSYYDQ